MLQKCCNQDRQDAIVQSRAQEFESLRHTSRNQFLTIFIKIRDHDRFALAKIGKVIDFNGCTEIAAASTRADLSTLMISTFRFALLIPR